MLHEYQLIKQKTAQTGRSERDGKQIGEVFSAYNLNLSLFFRKRGDRLHFGKIMWFDKMGIAERTVFYGRVQFYPTVDTV